MIGFTPFKSYKWLLIFENCSQLKLSSTIKVSHGLISFRFFITFWNCLSDKSKIVLPFGYPRILDLKKEYLDNSVNVKNKKTQKTILITPTWGSSSITETRLKNLFQQLVLKNHKIIYRPHPISLCENKNYILKMKKKFSDKIIFENDISKTNYLNYVDTLITDWSGFL